MAEEQVHPRCSDRAPRICRTSCLGSRHPGRWFLRRRTYTPTIDRSYSAIWKIEFRANNFYYICNVQVCIIDWWVRYSKDWSRLKWGCKTKSNQVIDMMTITVYLLNISCLWYIIWLNRLQLWQYPGSWCCVKWNFPHTKDEIGFMVQHHKYTKKNMHQ